MGAAGVEKVGAALGGSCGIALVQSRECSRGGRCSRGGLHVLVLVEASILVVLHVTPERICLWVQAGRQAGMQTSTMSSCIWIHVFSSHVVARTSCRVAALGGRQPEVHGRPSWARRCVVCVCVCACVCVCVFHCRLRHKRIKFTR